MKRIKKFFINTIILVFSSVLLRLIAMFFNIYITNKIGEEALGVFQLIMSVYLFAITFACSGINIASTKIIAEELAIGNKTSIKKITSKCIFISFVTGILASLLLFLGANIAVKYCMHNLISKSVIYLIYCACYFFYQINENSLLEVLLLYFCTFSSPVIKCFNV